MNPIDEYINSQEPELRERLSAVRNTIHTAIPEAEERISFRMPTFWKGRNIIHFAAFKNHIGIYPGGEATAVFAEKLAGLKTGKGTIQLPHNEELPHELIAGIATWCCERYGK